MGGELPVLLFHATDGCEARSPRGHPANGRQASLAGVSSPGPLPNGNISMPLNKHIETNLSSLGSYNRTRRMGGA